MRTATVLLALMPLVACSGGPDEHEVANDYEIATCEMFRSMEAEIGESDLVGADPVRVDDLLRVTVADMHNSAQRADNTEMLGVTDAIFEALAAWPLPPSIRDYPIAAAEMDSICSELGQ